MTSFHVNKKGDVGKCTATVKPCPHGGPNEHFDTAEQAQAYHESTKSTFGQGLLSKMRSKKRGMRLVAVSGALAASFSMTACDVNMSDVEKEIDKMSQSQEAPAGSQADPNGVNFLGKGIKPSASDVQDAKDKLSKLKVQEEPFVSSNRDKNPDIVYDRAGQFGSGFNTGVVGQTEKRDIPNGTFERKGSEERAVSGEFTDPYTGEKVQVVEGSRTDTNVDHVVPLKEAVQSGGLKTMKDPNQIANDPMNLQISGSKVNQSKSDKDAGEWLPSYKPAQCSYVIAQINVKAKYNLNVDNKESNAMKNVLATRC